MCIPDSRYRLTLAWVTCENSTMLLESDILRLFFTGPYLVSSPLCSVSGVDCPSVDPRQPLCSPLSCPAATPLSCPTTNCLLSALQPPTLSLLSNYQLSLLVSCHQLPTASLWVASSTLIRLPVPLPGTARFHVQESLVWFRAKTDN